MAGFALLLAAALAALALPGPRTRRSRPSRSHGPISVDGYGVAQQPMLAPSPSVDGYVVGMKAEIVDAGERPGPRPDDAAPHRLREDRHARLTCGGLAERFYAEGEERHELSLPRGYGYPNLATDRWGLLYMLMNHQPSG